jgi:hypothetical protein
MFKGWQELSSNDPATIEQWAKDYPGCNWGIDTGKSGLVVVDVDVKKHNGPENLDTFLERSNVDLPETLEVSTPSGGQHYYYRGNGCCRTGWLKGVDIRAMGGVLVAPGSSVDGRGYTFCSLTIPIAPAPDWLLETAKPIAKVRKDIPAGELDTPANCARALQYLKSVAPAIEGDSGDFHTYRVACWLRDLGVTPETCLGMMLEHFNPNCQPPWSGDSLWEKIENAYLYAQNSAGARTQDAASAEAKSVFDMVEMPRAEFRAFATIGHVNPPRIWIAESWIPAGRACPTLFTGEGGTGKSTLALQLGISVAAGEPWLGCATVQMPVLMVTCEDDDEEIDRRAYAMRAYDNLPNDERPFFIMPRAGMNSVVCAGNQDGAVRKGPFWQPLSDSLAKLGSRPKLLIVDTVADVFAGDENNRSEVNLFVKVIMGELAILHNATIVMLSHPPKGTAGKNPATYSGSTAWNNSVRNRIFLRWQSDEKKNSYRVLGGAKGNYKAPGGETTIMWDRGVFATVQSAELEDIYESAVLSVIATALDAGQALSASPQSPFYLGHIKITDPRGSVIPSDRVKEIVGSMLRARKIHQVVGDKKGRNGLFLGSGNDQDFMC